MSKLQGHGQAFGTGPPTLKDILYVDAHADGAQDLAGWGDDPFKRPFATVAFAVTQASYDTLVRVMPGHTEVINSANEWDFANVGIWVQGMGWGARRPTFTFATSTLAQVLLDKPSSTLENLLFKSTIDALVIGIRNTAADCKILNCEYREETTAEAIAALSIEGDRTLVDGIKIRGEGSSDQASALITIKSCDGAILRNFDLKGGGAGGVLRTIAVAPTNLKIDGGRGSYIWTMVDDLAIKCVAATKGSINGPIRIRLHTDAANLDECIVPTDMQVYQEAANHIGVVNADGESEWNWPGTISLDEA